MRTRMLAVLLAAIGNAQATVYHFSMTDSHKQAITGSFEGIAQGNLITDLSTISVALNGVSIGDGRAFTSARFAEGEYSWTTGAVASFDGLQNNFLFINSDYLNNDDSYSAYLYSVSWINGSYLAINPANYSSSMYGSPGDFSWSVTAANDVPEPANLALFGLALAGLGVMRPRSS